MNLFEKIFNYQIISRLEDSGTFMVTSHERAWLKTMLEHPAADEAFTPETLDKLRSILEQDSVMDTADHLIEESPQFGETGLPPAPAIFTKAYNRKDRNPFNLRDQRWTHSFGPIRSAL